VSTEPTNVDAKICL